MSSAAKTQAAASRHAGSVTERTTAVMLQMNPRKSAVRVECYKEEKKEIELVIGKRDGKENFSHICTYYICMLLR